MRWKRARGLKLVTEEDAPSRTRQVLREVRQSLGVAEVPKLYQAYAAFPEFLELHWVAFRPAVQTRQFFLLGARLAAEAYTRVHNYFDVPPVRHGDGSSAIVTNLPLSGTLDCYQYLDPLLLLIAAAQMQALEGPVGLPSNHSAPQTLRFASPSLLTDEQAGPLVQRSWNDRRRLLEVAFIADEHRALACWPEFYEEYWAALKPLLQSPVFADCQYRLAESALSMSLELPAAVETSIPQLLQAGVSDEQVSEAAQVNDGFVQALTGLLLDVTVARIGFEKGAALAQPAPANKPANQGQKLASSPIQAA
jgi:hypothetical protein